MTFVDAHQAGVRRPRLLRTRRQRSASSTATASPPTATASTRHRRGAPASRCICGRGAGEYRAYLPRARWIRDANDSYFAAMTYPQGLPVGDAADRHPRRHLGRAVGRLWRRRASRAPKATPRWPTPPCPLRAPVLGLDAVPPGFTRGGLLCRSLRCCRGRSVSRHTATPYTVSSPGAIGRSNIPRGRREIRIRRGVRMPWSSRGMTAVVLARSSAPSIQIRHQSIPPSTWTPSCAHL